MIISSELSLVILVLLKEFTIGRLLQTHVLSMSLKLASQNQKNVTNVPLFAIMNLAGHFLELASYDTIQTLMVQGMVEFLRGKEFLVFSLI